MSDYPCKKCGVVKPLSEFYKNPGNKCGHLTSCKACVKLYIDSRRDIIREREKQVYRENPARRKSILDRSRQWRKDNPEKVRAIWDKHDKSIGRDHKKAWHQANKTHSTEKHRLAKYGATPEDVKALEERQGGLCAICYTSLRDLRSEKVHLDHNHRSGKVRGLLCAKCNHLLGKCGDSKVILLSAISYLEEHDECE